MHSLLSVFNLVLNENGIAILIILPAMVDLQKIEYPPSCVYLDTVFPKEITAIQSSKIPWINAHE